MRIGIDIDGVLTNLEEFYIDYAIKFAYENKCKVEIQPENYSEVLKWSKQTEDAFWKKYSRFYSQEIKPRNFATEVIEKLKIEGHEIAIITARPYSLIHKESMEENEEIIKKWLEENKIYYDQLFFAKNEKISICIQNEIDVMIEDTPTNVQQIAKQIPVICYHCEYNRNCKGANIVRAYTWYDVYDKIQKII